MIPTFPKFVRLNLNHIDDIKNHTSKFLPYSDYNFVSLWCYDTKNEIDISILNDNLVVKFTDYLDNKRYFSFFGEKKFQDTSITLLNYCVQLKIDQKLIVIPEIFIKKNYEFSKINIIEDRHNFDYIYSLETLSALAGKKFDTKRYLFKKFNKIYPHHSLKMIDIKKELNHDKILELFYSWEKLKNKNRKDTQNELSALIKLFDNAKQFNLFVLGIFIEEKLEAFSIVETVHHDYAIIHFAKSNHNFHGINEALYKYSSDFLISKKCKYLNMEQDMGLENLRYAKNLWQPIFFLKKYTVEMK